MRSTRARHRRRANGFSLVEILVVVAVFSVTMLVATNIFLLTTKAQRQASNQQKTQGDIRFALEAIAREVRFGTVDYTCYDGVTPCDPTGTPQDLVAKAGSTPLLALRDFEGNRIRFMLDPGGTYEGKLAVCFIDITQEALTYCDDSVNWEAVTPEGVRVLPDGAQFSISPFRNPFTLCDPAAPANDPLACQGNGSPYLADTQPRVTVTLRTKQETDEVGGEDIAAQTTVTSRIYAR